MALKDKLLEKAKEAFLLAIEIYNKPTIQYRVEGFSFFLCNAWELMLKAYMIVKYGENSIYFKDNPNRTLSLENCIGKVFTNNKDPLRKNLEKIIELRNTSTHFIVQEYEMVYIPLFQAAVFNFVEKMQEFHNFDMSTVLPQNFLTLTVSLNHFNSDEFRAKYPEAIANRLIGLNNELAPMIDESNDRFAIRIEHRYYITKDKNSATAIVRVDPSSENTVKIVREWKDPNDTHKFPAGKCYAEINRILKKAGCTLKKDGIPVKFNNYHFKLFCKYYGIKTNPRFCYVRTLYSNPEYSYSIHAIQFIVQEIMKDPDHIIDNLREQLKKKS